MAKYIGQYPITDDPTSPTVEIYAIGPKEGWNPQNYTVYWGEHRGTEIPGLAKTPEQAISNAENWYQSQMEAPDYTPTRGYEPPLYRPEPEYHLEEDEATLLEHMRVMVNSGMPFKIHSIREEEYPNIEVKK